MIARPDALVPYGPGRRTGPSGLADADLQARLARYKRNVAKRYRIADGDAIERQLPAGALIVTAKIDGELWFLCRRAGEVALCAYNGRVLQGIPLVDEAARLLPGTDDVVVPGELFSVPPEGRPRCGHVARALGDAALADTLRFAPFDLAEEGDRDWQLAPFAERFARLRAWFEGGDRVLLPPLVEGDASVAAMHYAEWVGNGRFEGLVVRSEQGLSYKVKPTFTIDAVVVAYGERLVGEVRQMRELTLALRRDDGALHVFGTVGGGFGDDDRVAWLKRLSAMQVPSAFRMANRDGMLVRWVRPEIVVEVRCSDLIDTDSADLPIRRMVLGWDAEAGYQPTSALPIASLVHPVFERERTDKGTDAVDIGLDQVHARLPFEARHEAAVVRAVPRAEVVERRCWTKAAKGQTAVRKYQIVQTNKPADLAPPFVVFFTDWSAGRKTPLETTLRVASTREAADVVARAWVEENIKGGWALTAPDGTAEEPTPAPPRKKA